MPLIFSLLFLLYQPFVIAWIWFLVRLYSLKLHSGNSARRKALLAELGHSESERKRIVGFFHPYCNAGGGGERVLWTAISSMHRMERDVVAVVYSGDTDVSKEEIIAKVKSRFDITLDPSLLHFVFLKSRRMVEDSTWPRFTLLGQSLGSIYLAWEAMSKLIPDLYIDSMGYAFTYPLVSLLTRIPVGAYVHYPTISTDMLARVRSRQAWHTNDDQISSSAVLSRMKLMYYRFFMYHYSLSLRTASFLMVNSTWTKNHVDAILQHHDFLLDFLYLAPPLLAAKFLFLSNNAPSQTSIVYPPCDTREMQNFPLMPRERVILSVAQFRPEKDHKAQILAFHQLHREHPEHTEDPVKLVLIGGSRNEGDANRIVALKELVEELGISSSVEFIVNASYHAVLDWLSRASIGLSTMVDEHFGINIVEFMAAGVIPLTHKSGGPLTDIVVPYEGQHTGYHALTPTAFSAAMHEILTLPADEQLALRSRARRLAVERFSEEEFVKGWDSSGWKAFLRGDTKKNK